MCMNLLRVRNNKIDFVSGKDPYFNFVPCGVCHECRKLYADGYVARLLAHYNLQRSNYLPTYYCTLTYDRFHLPKYKGLVCFNKKHLQNFFKLLRKDFNFTYFVTSEYGDSTKRPHYHLLLFPVVNLSSKTVIRAVQKAWVNGSVYFGINSGRVVDSRPMFYCAKYLTKSSDDCFHIRKFKYFDMVDFVNNALPLGYSFRSFHLQSKGLGESLVSQVSKRDLINGYVSFIDNSCKSVRLPVPLYIYRKKCYFSYVNKNGNVSYTLNEFGKSLLKFKFLKKYHETFENVSSLVPCILPNIHLFSDINILVHPLDREEFISRLTPDYLKMFSAWKVLYSHFDFVPFSFKYFADDVDYLLDFLDLPDFVFDGSKFEHPLQNDFIILDKMFTKLSLSLKYFAYVNKQSNLRALQSLRSLRTGIKKSVVIEDFTTFTNITKLNLCLITFLNYKHRLKEEISDVDYVFSVPA